MVKKLESGKKSLKAAKKANDSHQHDVSPTYIKMEQFFMIDLAFVQWFLYYVTPVLKVFPLLCVMQ